MFGNLYFYLNRHHTTAHRQRDARVALASNFKGKMHSQQKHFTKCMTEMFALNYVLRFSPLMISGTPVERVSSFKYLGVNISEDLTWTAHIQTQVKKARQRLYICDS